MREIHEAANSDYRAYIYQLLFRGQNYGSDCFSLRSLLTFYFVFTDDYCIPTEHLYRGRTAHARHTCHGEVYRYCFSIPLCCHAVFR